MYKWDSGETFAKDRLIVTATEAFTASYIAKRWPVGFIGSGMSLVYGGVTWAEAVDIILDEAIERTDTIAHLGLVGIHKKRAERMSVMLKAVRVRKSGKSLDTNEKYVALELAQEAFVLAEKIDPSSNPESSWHDRANSANQIFAQLANDDSIAVELLLRKRRSDTPAGSISRIDFKLFLNNVHIQDFAAAFYRLSSFKGYLPPSLNFVLSKTIESLAKAGVLAGSTLPIDRRSIFAPLLGVLNDDARKSIFDRARRSARTTKWYRDKVPLRPLIDPLAKLRERFGISRFLTLNYDFELENLLMIPDLRRQLGRSYGISEAEKDGEVLQDIGSSSVAASFGLTRRLPDGNYIASDLYRPGAAARLFEFALNSRDHSAHIVHLHGRADHPDDMVARDDDYNRFYRRSGQGKESLERALDVTLLGNPILFVGIGLTEAEITRAFRQLVSDGRITPESPAFALMPLEKGEMAGWSEQAARFQLYGLHILHYGHPRRGQELSLPLHFEQVDRAIKRARLFRDKRNPINAEKEPFENSEKLAFIGQIAGDAAIWNWLAELLVKKSVDIIAELELSSIDRLRRFATGVIDFLEKLREKMYSVALDYEIGALSKDVENLINAVNGDLPQRGWHSSNETTWLRHNSNEKYPPYPLKGKRIKSCFEEILNKISPFTIGVIGDTGTGKGLLVRCILDDAAFRGRYVHRIFVNLNFGTEIDSATLVIRHFLCKISNISINSSESIEDLLQRDVSDDSLLVISGIERLFDRSGNPISAAFVTLLDMLTFRRSESKLDVIFFADSASIRRNDIQSDDPGRTRSIPVKFIELGPADWESGFHAFLRLFIRKWLDNLNNRKWVEYSEIERRLMRIEQQGGYDRHKFIQIKRTTNDLIGLVLDYLPVIRSSDAQNHTDRSQNAAYDLAILNVLSLVGAPLEADVLSHAPQLRAIFIRLNVDETEWRKKIQQSLELLIQMGFVHDVKSVPSPENSTHQRYSLHRSVLQFMRERLGVSIGDGNLAHNFSLTLATSLPLDTMIPDEDIRSELKVLIGHFRSCWKDARIPPEMEKLFEILRKDAADLGDSISAEGYASWEAIRQIERIVLKQSAPSSQGLRAAANLVRSFFSAASLVTADPFDQDPLANPPEFDAHKRRIQDIFTRLRELFGLDRRLGQVCGTLRRDLPHADPVITELENSIRNMGLSVARPLYGAEIAWLHNERASIALLQGDLYEAEFSFRNARIAIEHYKADACLGGREHNLVRVDINRVMLLIERGYLVAARSLLEDIDRRMQTGMAQEQRVLVPIVEGYRGLAEHLMGRPDEAKAYYERSIDGLARTGQLRALGGVLITRAALWRVLGKEDNSKEDVGRAILAAEAGRQIDLLWRARLVRRPEKNDGGEQERLARKALEYARSTGVIRIEVEALLCLIGISEQRQNYEQAMHDTTLAMTAAMRGGMTLRRIGLRVVMGRLMLKSRDPAGEYLLRRAIAHADRAGYQAAVERAQQALAGVDQFGR